MTRVCLVGEEEVELRQELLQREGSRRALAAYDLSAPWRNTVAVGTVSLGAAVALLNDLEWYLVRFARDALVFEPSVSDREWLSRAVATAIRDQRVPPSETGRLLKIYGVSDGRLVEPMFAQRVNERLPEYDLREVEETVSVRITEAEFG